MPHAKFSRQIGERKRRFWPDREPVPAGEPGFADRPRRWARPAAILWVDEQCRTRNSAARSENASAAFGLIANQFQQANPALRIDPDGGLVQQQYFGLMNNAAREIQPPDRRTQAPLLA